MSDQDKKTLDVVEEAIESLTEVTRSFAEAVRTYEKTFQTALSEEQTRHQEYLKTLTDSIAHNQKELTQETAECNRELMDNIMSNHRADLAKTMQNHREDLIITMQHHKADVESYTKSQHKMHILSGSVLAASLVLGGIYTFYHSQATARQATLSALYKQHDWAATTETHETKVKDGFLDAGIKFRAAVVEGQLYCKDGRYSGANPIEYRQKLFSEGYAVIGPSFKVRDVFPKIINKVMNFNSAASMIEKFGVCSKNVPTGHQLRIMQTEIDDMMSQSIQETNQKKETIEKKILELEK